MSVWKEDRFALQKVFYPLIGKSLRNNYVFDWSSRVRIVRFFPSMELVRRIDQEREREKEGGGKMDGLIRNHFHAVISFLLKGWMIARRIASKLNDFKYLMENYRITVYTLGCCVTICRIISTHNQESNILWDEDGHISINVNPALIDPLTKIRSKNSCQYRELLMLQNTRAALARIIPLGELIARGKNTYCTCKRCLRNCCTIEERYKLPSESSKT